VARGRESANRDPHRRFAEWLETSAEEDPPRDLAVHAAVCAGCQQRIAAIDMLTAVDPVLAGIPTVRAMPTRAWLRTTGRTAVMVGGLAMLAAVGIGSWRLMQASELLGPAVASPTQAVLGGTGLPEPTPTTSVAATEQPSSSEPTPPAPAATERPTEQPPVIVQPTPPPALATAQPTVRQTASPKPTRTPAPTATAPPPPTPAQIAQCSDLVDNDGDLLIDVADPGCSGPEDDDESDL
jgi:hypothetical protein